MSRIDEKVEEIANQRFDELQAEIKDSVLKEVSEAIKRQRKEGNIATIIMVGGAVLFFLVGLCCGINIRP